MRRRRTIARLICTATLAVFALLVACSKSESSSGTSNATTPALPTHPITQAARDTFKTRCAACHGETGRADGPAIAKLPKKPPNFGDPLWQKATTDEELRKTILEGGPAVGKSAAMPAGHDLFDGKPDLLDGVVGLVRSFDGAS